MIKFFKQKNKSSKGFTLVETLVSISIFSVSLVSLMVILGRSISDTGYAKKKETAAYLTQEGIEYMRNLRDTYVLYHAGGAQAGWDAFKTKLAPSVGTLCESANGCYFNADSLNYSDPTQPMINLPILVCSSSTCSSPPLLYDSTTGKYGYTSGTNSGFIRKIWITQPSINEVKVFSKVSWVQGSGTYSLTFSENLYNWVE